MKIPENINQKALLVIFVSLVDFTIRFLFAGKMMSFFLPTVLTSIIACNIPSPGEGRIAKGIEIQICMAVSGVSSALYFLVFFLGEKIEFRFITSFFSQAFFSVFAAAVVGSFYTFKRV